MMRQTVRYIPKGATKVVPKGIQAEIYLYNDQRGRPCARAFEGKAIKPSVHAYFRNEKEREAYLTKFVKDRAKTEEFRAKLKAEKKAATRLSEIGDIYVASGGYDQTNVNFFQVVGFVGNSTIVCRAIAAVSVDQGPGWSSMSDHVVAEKNKFIGPEFKAREKNGSFKVDYRYAHKWDGSPRYRSWYA